MGFLMIQNANIIFYECIHDSPQPGRAGPRRGPPRVASRCLGTDGTHAGSPGVTTGFRFPRGRRRFPGEGRCCRGTARTLPSFGFGRRGRPGPRAGHRSSRKEDEPPPPPEKARYPAARARARPVREPQRPPRTPRRGSAVQGASAGRTSRWRPDRGLPAAAGSAPGPSEETGSRARGSRKGAREAALRGSGRARGAGRAGKLRVP